jgi:AraC-like DNA-binding protein
LRSWIGEPAVAVISTSQSAADVPVGQYDQLRMSAQPPARHLLRARDFVDGNYASRIDVDDMARVAGYSRAHFTREFKAAFGESPRAYLLTRRLERAASLLRSTDWPVAEVCWAVGLSSVGSFTTSFTRMFEMTPSEWRASGPPPESIALVPTCMRRLYGRPVHRTFREGPDATAP